MDYKNHIEHYKKDAEFFDYFPHTAVSEQEMIRRYQEYSHLYKIKRNDKILEIGSGAGYSAKIFDISIAHYFPFDISTYNLRKIKEGLSSEIFPVSGDVYKMPFTDGSFNLILLAEVLEHLGDTQMALTEIRRILKSGGSLIVSVPYKEIISYQMCIHCSRPTPTNAHLHSFDEDKLNGLLNAAGFTVTKKAKCLNKVSNRFRWNLLTKKLPFVIWNIFDTIFNRIIDKPTSLIMMAEK